MIALTPSERVAYRALERADFTVLRNGWPDFLAVNDTEILAVEVKAGADPLSRAQRNMHHALSMAGLPVVVIRDPQPEWRPTQTASLAFHAFSLEARVEELRSEIDGLEHRRVGLLDTPEAIR